MEERCGWGHFVSRHVPTMPGSLEWKLGLIQAAIMDQNAIKEYPFQGANEANGYKLFPAELEGDEHVFFHGTAEASRQSIIDNGFRIGGELPSVSFARTSALPLKYACEARSAASPEGCVLAVKFPCLNKPEIVAEAFGLHVYKFDEQPTIVGYCIIPANYIYW